MAIHNSYKYGQILSGDGLKISSVRYRIYLLKMILDKIIEELKKDGLDKYFEGEQKWVTILENRAKVINEVSNNSLAVALPPDTPADSVKKIQEIVEKAVEASGEPIELQFEQKLGVGDKLPNFGDIKKVFEQGTSLLAPKDGQVLLIDVWATWCGPCQKPMAHNQEMLTKNNWGDKVRIVGVSVDDDIDSIKQRVESKGWKKVQHLTLGGWKHDHSLIKAFSVSGIPFVVLVDTNGQIAFSGHPSSINLEEKINELIKEGGGHDADKPQQKKKQLAPLTKDDYTKIVDTVGKKQYFSSQFQKLDFLSTKIEVTSKFSKGHYCQNAEVWAYVQPDDKPLLEQYEHLLPKSVKFTPKIVQSVEVPQVPDACSECKGELKYPLYWCQWSGAPGDFRCRKCVEKKESPKVYHYKQNSILLVDAVKSVAKSNIGENIQPAKVEDVTVPNQFGCNGCGSCPQTIGEARYVCAGCRSEPNYRGDYVDLCQDCMNKYCDGDADVESSLTPDGHQRNHPFLRILYNVKGYYKF